MKVFATLLLAAACATTPAPTPPERIFGCWISRANPENVMMMRFLRDASAPGVLNGHVSTMTSSTPYRLEPRGAEWALCEAQAGGACWTVAQGDEGSLEGGRAFIDAHDDYVRLSVVNGGAEREIFQGARDGCD